MKPPQVLNHFAIGKRSNIPYVQIRPAETRSETVCFMCPGTGYSFDKPLLYYSTMLMLQKSIDVVHIQYNYQDKPAFWELSREEQSDWMYEDVNAVAEKVLAEHSYGNFLFLGKSVGTMPIANGLCRDPRFAAAKAVLLTPIIDNEKLAKSLMDCQQEMLIVIGTNDHFYHEANLEAIRSQKPNIRLSVIQEANHALEIGWDVSASLAVMQRVMKQLDRFVEGSPLLTNSLP
ncbi:alpha/beta family hydrolase [Brevibacillus sp. H7]|uniref:alpha/beta family hydrolase n=1 Tax=Brevibacillus sp. H7 TaxID=3349138 RepID=UPI0038305414